MIADAVHCLLATIADPDRTEASMTTMTMDRKNPSTPLAARDNALSKAAENEARALRRLNEAAEAQRSWHLVQIAQPSLTLASEQLKWAGYSFYAPQMREMTLPKTSSLSLAQRKHRHLFGKEKLSPFFGAYRFVRFDSTLDPWHDLFKLVGVHGIGVADNLPVPMPDEFIAGLRAKEINGAIPGSTPVKALGFRVGDTAKVNIGPFVGFEGTVERVNESGRVRILLDIFTRQTPIDLTADELDRVDQRRGTRVPMVDD